MTEPSALKFFPNSKMLLASPPRWWWGLLVLWVLAMIAIPILIWTYGESILPIASSFTTLLLAGLSGSLLVQQWGIKVALPRLAGILVFSWAIEWLGATHAFPFGNYHYTAALQPQLLGVPLLIPFAWLMLLPSAWAIAASIDGKWHGARFALLSGIALTAWDLFLDPQMVKWGFWQWEHFGWYFGIPLQNFAGWVATVTVFSFLLRPPALPLFPLIVIYAVTWFLQSVGLIFFFDLRAPGLVGAGAMGLLLAVAIYRLRANHSHLLQTRTVEQSKILQE
ncbi:MAG TPA: carotenoid biosynthesis protein [Anaerolineales bacterium]|nr:carotenoid biosynthesis protein [Anaerolineales bacterium]